MNGTQNQKRSRVQGSAWSGTRQDTKSSETKTKVNYDKDAKNLKATHKIYRPGLVLLPSALDWTTQNWLIDLCFSVGKSTLDDKEGFYEEKDGRMVLNQGTRGRVIKSANVFPEEFRELCLKMLEKARALDQTIPNMDPNTILINYYNEKASFKWHKDSEDPNLIKTKQGKPIISFSIGQSAIFAYKMKYEDTNYSTIRLNSGDVLIFGGPSRMIVHSVQEIIGKTLPAPLISKMRSGRLNLTIRDIGIGKIDKSKFPAYRVVYDNDENEEEAG